MKIQPTDNTNFKIYKGSEKKSYGEYMWGMYKGKKIEVFDAFKYHQKLIYVSKCMKFIKSKLTYWLDGSKKITRSEGRGVNI